MRQVVTSEAVGNSSVGTVSLDGNGHIVLSNLPNEYSGTVTFSYQTQDPSGALSNVATVTVNVDLLAPDPITNIAHNALAIEHASTAVTVDLLITASIVDANTGGVISDCHFRSACWCYIEPRHL